MYDIYAVNLKYLVEHKSVFGITINQLRSRERDYLNHVVFKCIPFNNLAKIVYLNHHLEVIPEDEYIKRLNMARIKVALQIS